MEEKELKPTPQQQEAIEYTDGPLLIVAGPGTGKTKVLIEKVVYLIQKKKINPNKILVSTFTVKAAEELKDRLRERLGNNVESMQLSTIHSFCQTMLDEFSDSHRFGASFRVLDDEDQYIFVKSKAPFEFKLKDVIKPYEVSDLIHLYDKLSENNVKPEELITHLKAQKASERDIKIAESYDKYLTALRIENLVDFANLQKEFVYLLEINQKILEKIRSKFDYMLIDEYQDTNPIQDRIFYLIAEPKFNICVVGDEDQSIYGFRGASVENFRNFAKVYKNSMVIKLEDNFRSGNQIVNFTDSFMKNHRTYAKTIKSVRKATNSPILIRGRGLDNEAEQVVGLIEKLKKDGSINHYGDVAILFRSVRNHSFYFTEYLKEKKIPFYVVGDGAFLERDEVRTILWLMAFVKGYNPDEKVTKIWKWWNNSLLFNHVLNLSTDTKNKLKKIINENGFVNKLNYKYLTQLGIERADLFLLLRLIDRKKIVNTEQKKKYSLTQLFYDILKITGYLKKIIDSKNEEDLLQVHNLGLLSNIIYKFETTAHDNNFKHFFDHLFYLPDDKAHDSAYIENTKSVKLMTVHQAKGLEFPVVVLGSVIKQRFPSANAKRKSTFFDIPEVFLMGKQDYKALAEERRLFYVGMTRAQDLLVVSTTDAGRYKPSEYITEIGISKFNRPENVINKCEKSYIKQDEIPRLSYSAINNFLSCPFRYSLNYLYKFQTPPTYFQNYGVVVHNALQRIHLDIQQGRSVDIQRVKEITNNCWIPVNFDKRKDEKMKADLVERLWNYIRKGTKNYGDIIEVEKPFSYIGKNFVIRGKVDLIAKDETGALNIIDFKSRNVEGLDQTMVDLQLRMYNLALEHEYKVVGLFAYTFRDNMKTPFSNTAEDLKIAKETIVKVGQDINDETFQRNLHSKFCPACMYSFLCDLRKKK